MPRSGAQSAPFSAKAFHTFCHGLMAVSHVVQWGGADVYKVGGKVFAIAREEETGLTVTFKVTPLAYDILREQPGLRPAPYLASRGMTWIQHFEPPGLDPQALRDYVRQSHSLVAAGLSKKRQRELGLMEEGSDGPGESKKGER